MSRAAIENWFTSKQASAAALHTDDDVERAFMEQAVVAVQNRVPTLMQPKFRLGFEVVWSDTPANTRLIGVFGFRGSSEILLAPVFFLDGVVKGAVHLYRKGAGRFVFLNEEWAKELTDASSRDGDLVTRSQRFDSPARFRDILYPNAKRASAGPESPDGCDWDDPGAEFRPLLRDFLGAHCNPSVLEKIAEAMDESFDVACAFRNLGPDVLRPEGWAEKLAAEAPRERPVLLVHTGLGPDLPPGRLGDLTKRGYVVEDRRLSPHTVVDMGADPDEWTSPPDSGCLCRIGIPGDKLTDVLVARKEGGGALALGDKDCCNPSPAPYAGVHTRQRPALLAVRLSDGAWADVTDGTMVNSVSPLSETVLKGLPDLREEPVENALNLVFDIERGAWLGVVYPDKVEKDDDGVLRVLGHASNWLQDSYYFDLGSPGTDEIVVNPDLVDFWESPVLGRGVRFVKVECDREKMEHSGGTRLAPKERFTVGNAATFRQWMFAKPSMGVVAEDGGRKVRITARGGATWPEPPAQAAVKIAARLGIPGEIAEAIVDAATAQPGVELRFGLEFPAAWGEEKRAGAMRFLDNPNIEDDQMPGMDGVFGLPVNESPITKVMQTVRDPSTRLQPRLGDAWDPTLGHDSRNPRGGGGLDDKTLMGLDEQGVARMTGELDLPQVFDHAAVGSMIRHYNAVHLVDQYLPDLELGLDRLLRLLFLMWWKPKDFEKAYGSEDAKEREDNLMSLAEQYSDMILDLRQKGPHREGSAPLT